MAVAASKHDWRVQLRSHFITGLAGLTAGLAAVTVGVVLGVTANRVTDAGSAAGRGRAPGQPASAAGDVAPAEADGAGNVAARPLPFVVAWGDEGTVLTDGNQLTQLSQIGFQHLRSGAFAAQVDDNRAVVVTPDELHMVDRSGLFKTVDCVGCMGVVVDDGEIVTAHDGGSGDDAFEVEVFDDDLTPLHTVAVPVVGVPVRSGGALQRPSLLASSSDRLTVSYLSADAIEEGGPSVVAQYSSEGEPLTHVVVEGTVDQAAVSPDGSMIAIAVARHEDSCDPASAPTLLSLEDLEEVEIGKAVPPELGDAELRFRTTDLHWNGAELSATGQVSRIQSGSTDGDPCDAHPGLWRMRYDATNESTSYSPGGPLLAQRRFAGDCSSSVSVQPVFGKPALVGSNNDDAMSLGEYRELALGAAPDSCSANIEALPSTWPGSAATEIYFVGQLYDGDLSLPGLADESDTALSTPIVTPSAMKLGSGVTWSLEGWSGWGTAEATARGTFVDHTEFESDGTVVLSRPKMCGSSLMYSRIEQRWDRPMPPEIAAYTPGTIDLQGCT